MLKFEDRPIPKLKSPYGKSQGRSFALPGTNYGTMSNNLTYALPILEDVMINVRFTGICGSDIHYWKEGAIGTYVVKDPIVLGHESSGVITEVGEQVKTLKVGDRVCMEPGVPCRRCSRCKDGRYNLCPDMAFAATPPIDGTLAKYYSLPEDFCFKLPDGVSLEEGALMEPLSVAVHITRQADIKPGQSVVIFGAGPVGLLCCAVAKVFGANKIVSVDMNEDRLAFAAKFAASQTIVAKKESAEDAAARIVKQCDLGPGADAIIDATGAEPCINTALHALRNGGTYVQGGMGKSTINFPIMAVCTKELNVRGSFRYGSGDYATAVGMVASGRISVKECITGTVPFKEAAQAFEDVHQAKGIKTLIEGIQADPVSTDKYS